VPPSVAAAGPFAHIVEENLDEAAFLWGRWEAELSSLTRDLDEVWSWTEDRLNGAVDGVLVAHGELFSRVIERALAQKEPAFHTLAAHLMTVAPDPAERASLAHVVCNAQGASLAAMVRGIEVSNLDGTFSTVTRALMKRGPRHCAALARIKSFQRAALGDELAVAWNAESEPEQLEAMRAAAFLREPEVTRWVNLGLAHASARIRLAAIQSGIRQRQHEAWGAAREAVASGEPGSRSLLRFMAMFGKAPDHQLIYEALQDAESARAAFWALGHLGTREAAEHCLAAMPDARVGRLAGEAYAAITGIDLARERLTAPDPVDAPSLPPFEEDDLDADLVPRHEDLWPLPDAERCTAHWSKVGARFAPNTRYARGAPFELAVLLSAIDKGPMLRRGDYAFELYVRTNGACDVETRAAGFTQRHMVAAAKAQIGQVR
jgi:uncharacterized protein (TIGR02270 family)